MVDNEEESKLFMAQFTTNHNPSNLWFVDSNCPNHMTCLKSIFHVLDKSQKMTVQLGNGKELQVEGKGKVGLETSHGKLKFLHNVQFVPDLDYSLLSVGQLMASGYSILFDNDTCAIKEKQSGQELLSIRMTQNKMFPLDVSNVGNFVLAAGGKDDSRLWHLGYMHLNIKGLELLSKKGMVLGLPKIGSIELCESCV